MLLQNLNIFISIFHNHPRHPNVTNCCSIMNAEHKKKKPYMYRTIIIFHNPFWKYFVTIAPLAHYCNMLSSYFPFNHLTIAYILILLLCYMHAIHVTHPKKKKILDLCASYTYNSCHNQYFACELNIKRHDDPTTTITTVKGNSTSCRVKD